MPPTVGLFACLRGTARRRARRLTHLAAHTERIKLGTGCVVLPQREPLVLAKQLAGLDVLSHGRLGRDAGPFGGIAVRRIGGWARSGGTVNYMLLICGDETAADHAEDNKMADRSARRDAAAMSAAELAAVLRDKVTHPWKPPGGGFEGALTHDVIHGLDFTVPLGIDRHVPEDRLRILLRGLDSQKSRRFFGVDLRDIELRADDMEWTLGSGTPMWGAAQDLALVVCGRRLPAGRLRGEPAERFTDA